MSYDSTSLLNDYRLKELIYANDALNSTFPIQLIVLEEHYENKINTKHYETFTKLYKEFDGLIYKDQSDDFFIDNKATIEDYTK